MKMFPRKLRHRAATLLLSLLASWNLGQSARAYDWLQFEFNPEKTGNNTLESTVNASNVSSLKLLFDVALPGGDNPDGAPVLLTGVSTPSGVRDLVFVQGEHGHLTAFDAHTGAVVWGRGAIAGVSYGNTAPAIDPNRQFIYYSGNDGLAHKINVGDGTEVTTGGFPAATGGGKAGPQLTIATAANGHTYLYCANLGTGTGTFGKGHETVIDLANGSEHIFNNCASEQPDTYSPNTSTNGCRPWSRSTIYDPSLDRVYYMAANNSGTNWVAGHVWRESWLALAPDGSTRVDSSGGWPVDSYTPTNWSNLVDSDQDIGTGGMGLLPVGLSSKYPHLGVTPGKDKNIRILNLADMSGQGGPGHLGGELSIYNESTLGLMRANCCVWPNPANSDVWVFVPGNNGIAGFKVAISSAGNPSLSLQWTITGNWTTSAFVANNVLYAARGGGENTGSQSTHQVTAINPTTGKVLWSGAIDEFHWASPILANGIVYMADGNSGGFSGPGGHLRAWSLGNVPTQAAAPVFNPNGGTFLLDQPVSVTITSATSGASIRYTTDGSTPTETAGTLYSGPVSLTSSTNANIVLKAIAYAAGFSDSSVTSATYSFVSDTQAAAPVFTPPGGSYATAQNVSITSATSGVTIRYTTDGSTPTETAGTIYSGPVNIASSLTLKAIAYAAATNSSAVTSAPYTIGTGGGTTVSFEAENLSYTPSGATASVQTDANSSGGHWVLLSGNSVGDNITYSIPTVQAGTYQLQMEWKGLGSRGILQLSVDGTNLGPTLDQYSSSATYPTTAFGTVTFASSGTHTIRLTVTGKNSASSGYGLSADKFTFLAQSGGGSVSAPTFSPAGGTYSSAQNVTISTSTPGATIRYTTDGSTPSETNGTIYSGPVNIASTATLKAIAYESGMTDSAVTSATYTISSGTGGTTVSFEAENLSYTPSGATASVQTDANSSGGHWVLLYGNSVGDNITYSIPAVQAGTYQLQMEWKGLGSRGILQLSVDGTNLGPTLDQYSSSATYPTTTFGTVTFGTTGTHTVRLTVTGKNSASSGYGLSADKFTFVGQ